MTISQTFQFGELDAFGKKDVKGKQKETAVTDDGITKELWAVVSRIVALVNQSEAHVITL